LYFLNIKHAGLFTQNSIKIEDIQKIDRKVEPGENETAPGGLLAQMLV
jgi:hypothetical protein